MTYSALPSGTGPIPDLHALWRPNDQSATEDREAIRQAAEIPATQLLLRKLTLEMNRVAELSPPVVRQVQAWIDEILELEEQWGGMVSDGSARLGNLQTYEGPIPGRTLTEDDRTQEIGPIKVDTSLLKVRMVAGPRSESEGDVIQNRVALLQGRILEALGLAPQGGGGRSTAYLVRS
jgi:hypothetical protein